MEKEISKKFTDFDQEQIADAVITLLVPTQNILNQNISVDILAS